MGIFYLMQYGNTWLFNAFAVKFSVSKYFA